MTGTITEHDETLRLKPMVERLAARYNRRGRDDEYTGIALLALCEAVRVYSPDHGMSIDDFVLMTVRNKLNNAHRRESYERDRGLSGGAPREQALIDSRGSGRRVSEINYENKPANWNSRNMDRITAPLDFDEKRYLENVIDMLPARLQQVAIARWIDGDELTKIATDEGLTYHQVRYALEEAEKFAKLYTCGGNS